ncbi:MAG: M67 family metallopeptidase [Emcibacter sp.]|nr:M67 family metallopeptidase [Emcibacter sp.]
MKKLFLPTDLEAQIRGHCEDNYPQEACGILIGQGGQVTKVIPSPNLSATPEKSFEIDPALIIHHQRDCRAGSDKIIGHYHSHPDGQAVPSTHDHAQNYDEALIWVIVSVTKKGAQDMNAFATHDGQLVHMVISTQK